MAEPCETVKLEFDLVGITTIDGFHYALDTMEGDMEDKLVVIFLRDIEMVLGLDNGSITETDEEWDFKRQ